MLSCRGCGNPLGAQKHFKREVSSSKGVNRKRNGGGILGDFVQRGFL